MDPITNQSAGINTRLILPNVAVDKQDFAQLLTRSSDTVGISN